MQQNKQSTFYQGQDRDLAYFFCWWFCLLNLTQLYELIRDLPIELLSSIRSDIEISIDMPSKVWKVPEEVGHRFGNSLSQKFN